MIVLSAGGRAAWADDDDSLWLSLSFLHRAAQTLFYYSLFSTYKHLYDDAAAQAGFPIVKDGGLARSKRADIFR